MPTPNELWLAAFNDGLQGGRGGQLQGLKFPRLASMEQVKALLPKLRGIFGRLPDEAQRGAAIGWVDLAESQLSEEGLRAIQANPRDAELLRVSAPQLVGESKRFVASEVTATLGKMPAAPTTASPSVEPTRTRTRAPTAKTPAATVPFEHAGPKRGPPSRMRALVEKLRAGKPPAKAAPPAASAGRTAQEVAAGTEATGLSAGEFPRGPLDRLAAAQQKATAAQGAAAGPGQKGVMAALRGLLGKASGGLKSAGRIAGSTVGASSPFTAAEATQMGPMLSKGLGVGVPVLAWLAMMYAAKEAAEWGGQGPEIRGIEATHVPSGEEQLLQLRADEIRQKRAMERLAKNPELLAALQMQAAAQQRQTRGMARGDVVIGQPPPDQPQFENAGGLMDMLSGVR